VLDILSLLLCFYVSCIIHHLLQSSHWLLDDNKQCSQTLSPCLSPNNGNTRVDDKDIDNDDDDADDDDDDDDDSRLRDLVISSRSWRTLLSCSLASTTLCSCDTRCCVSTSATALSDRVTFSGST